MMAIRRRVRTSLGDVVDITQPIDISGSLATYTGASPSLMLPPPPVISSAPPSIAPAIFQNPALVSQMSAENLQAQQAALNQGFLSTDTALLWLQENAGLVLAGLGIVGAVVIFGGRKRR